MTARRPIAVALAASAMYSGVLVATARAEMHYVRVTLVTGQQLTVTVDVPPGTPVSQIQIPGLPAPVASIVDLGSAESTATPTATAPPVSVTVSPTPGATQTPAGGGTNRGGGGGSAGGGGSGSGKPATQPVEGVKNTVKKAAGNTQSLTGAVPQATPTPEPEPEQPPAPSDPTYTLAPPGAAKVGVP